MSDLPVVVDALEGKSWGGIVVAQSTDTAFGVRFATDILGLLDADSIYEAVREVGPHAPDGSYCRLRWSVAPAPGDMFSIRWKGKLLVPDDGSYAFHITSDDGCRLWIDSQLIIDEWWDRVPTEFSASMDLNAGEHDIRLDYYESVGSASVKLEWSSDAIGRQVIPETALRAGEEPGLKGSYYYGTEFQDLAFERIDPRIDFDYGHSGPLPERKVEEQVSLEWSDSGDGRVVGKLTLDGRLGGNLLMLAYFPWDYQGSYEIADGEISGACGGRQFAVRTSPGAVGEWLAANVDELKSTYTSDRSTGKRLGNAAAGLKLPISPGKPVYFTLSLGETPQCSSDAIDARLNEARKAYADRRTEVDGHYAGAGESVTNNIHWMRLLIPHTGVTYVPAGRVWLWSSWTVFEWDGFFNALLASVENPELARSMIDALLLTQQPNGNFPNVANDPSGVTSVARSQPQVGSYCAWKLYLRLGRDREFLRKVYEPLARWHGWWLADGGTGKPRRDGNGDGLLEWGSDKANMQDAKFESGMDDAALYDDAAYIPETWTMNMNCVDCSSLYALDALCLAKMAAELGHEADAVRYEAEHVRLKQLINELLWSDDAGMYLDRFWDGKFSTRRGCSNFYALIGQVATPERAGRMMRVLNDPAQFRGKWMIPTISRSDPAFKDQGYWRGTVWPPTNYLAYEGIKAYGFDAEAAVVAESGADLFLENWRSTGTCRENYRSDTGEGGGQKYQSWGPLFSLIAMHEFADVDALDGGMRFGSFTTRPSTARRLRLSGCSYDITIGGVLRVVRDGCHVIEADGPLVLRGYRVTKGQLTFQASAASRCKLTIREPGLTRGRLDGGTAVQAEPDGCLLLQLERGTHRIECS